MAKVQKKSDLDIPFDEIIWSFHFALMNNIPLDPTLNEKYSQKTFCEKYEDSLNDIADKPAHLLIPFYERCIADIENVFTKKDQILITESFNLSLMGGQAKVFTRDECWQLLKLFKKKLNETKIINSLLSIDSAKIPATNSIETSAGNIGSLKRSSHGKKPKLKDTAVIDALVIHYRSTESPELLKTKKDFKVSGELAIYTKLKQVQKSTYKLKLEHLEEVITRLETFPKAKARAEAALSLILNKK